MKVDAIVKGYIALRDKKTELKRKQQEEMAPLNEAMNKLEAWLQRELQRQGVQNFKTEEGTAFLQTDTRCTVKDWEACLNYILENEEYGLLEARVSKTAIRDVLENTGELVPGVSLTEETVCRVRR